MRFNKAKGKILHMGQGNPLYQYKVVMNGLEAALRRRAWGYWGMKS